MPIPFYLAAFFFGAATFALGLAAFFFGVGWAASAASFHFASFVAALRLRMACACESCAMMLVLCGEGSVNIQHGIPIKHIGPSAPSRGTQLS